MPQWRSETRVYLIRSALLLSMFSFQNDAHANSIQRDSGARATHSHARATHSVSSRSGYSFGYGHGRYFAGHHLNYAMAHGRQRSGYQGWGISCVPYAREVSGIDVPGNAWQWWYNAAGQYARGRMPESGSVLAFRANGRMRMGHVAVVSRVINAREVLIDHANWAGGGVRRGVSVVDVSEANDWSAVRVELPGGQDFGSVYPTYGFIYSRPDRGAELVTASAAPAPIPVLNPAPSDLRPVAERSGWRTFEEVAEAPAYSGSRHRHLDLRVSNNYR